MITENNLFNKEKFFALYYRQNIGMSYYYVGSSELKRLSVQGLDVGALNHIQLKPWRSLSDEDYSNIAAIIKQSTYENMHPNHKQVIDEILMSIDKRRMCFDFTQQVIDYLRFHGYAIGWMDLSVQQLIDYGWVRLV